MSLAEPFMTVQATMGCPLAPTVMLGRNEAPGVATMAPPRARLPSDCQPAAVSWATSIWKVPLRESAQATYFPFGPVAMLGVTASAGLLLRPPSLAEPANSVQRPW